MKQQNRIFNKVQSMKSNQAKKKKAQNKIHKKFIQQPKQLMSKINLIVIVLIEIIIQNFLT